MKLYKLRFYFVDINLVNLTVHIYIVAKIFMLVLYVALRKEVSLICFKFIFVSCH